MFIVRDTVAGLLCPVPSAGIPHRCESGAAPRVRLNINHRYLGPHVPFLRSQDAPCSLKGSVYNEPVPGRMTIEFRGIRGMCFRLVIRYHSMDPYCN